MKQMKNAAEDELQPGLAHGLEGAVTKQSEATLLVNHAGEWIASEELRAWLVAPPPQNEAALDMAGLTHVDAACFQVLVSAAQAGLFADGRVRLVNVPESVRHCFRYAGADMLLAGAEEVR